eukprot:TRINITY_DN90637_c0_g1_i1.p1 TRINITY_DN90637_c0_g1~~TRINITY_DN90637_c0_g1_i1.p1  ORF type:complete len:389 (+),score=32.24 TRINITY_DN90637_c0_g1_i1:76-1242(+)
MSGYRDLFSAAADAASSHAAATTRSLRPAEVADDAGSRDAVSCYLCGEAHATARLGMWTSDDDFICDACAEGQDFMREVVPGDLPLLLLQDLNGVLLHRLKDGGRLQGTLELQHACSCVSKQLLWTRWKIRQSTNEQEQMCCLECTGYMAGYVHYTLPRPGCADFLHGLARLAAEKRFSWGFYTSLQLRNAALNLGALFGWLGFDIFEVGGKSSRLGYRIGQCAGSLWLFTQESMQKDLDARAHANTGHFRDLPTIAPVHDCVCELDPGNAPRRDRVIMVLGSKKKAKLCRAETMLVPDFGEDAAREVAAGSPSSKCRESAYLHRVLSAIATAASIGAEWNRNCFLVDCNRQLILSGQPIELRIIISFCGQAALRAASRSPLARLGEN